MVFLFLIFIIFEPPEITTIHSYFVISFYTKKIVCNFTTHVFYTQKKLRWSWILLFNTSNWHSLGFILSYDFRFIHITKGEYVVCTKYTTHSFFVIFDTCVYTLPIAFIWNEIFNGPVKTFISQYNCGSFVYMYRLYTYAFTSRIRNPIDNNNNNMAWFVCN